MIKKYFLKIICAGVFISLFRRGSSNYAPLDVVDKIDVNRYICKWCGIANLPNSFQKGCNCTTIEYSIINKETIRLDLFCHFDPALEGGTL